MQRRFGPCLIVVLLSLLFLTIFTITRHRRTAMYENVYESVLRSSVNDFDTVETSSKSAASHKNMKTLLWYDTHEKGMIENTTKLGFSPCEYRNCQYKSYLSRTDAKPRRPFDVDAILIQSDGIFDLSPPPRRDEDQVFVLAVRDSFCRTRSARDPGVGMKWLELFNWTMTYRLDSDIVYKYANILERDNKTELVGKNYDKIFDEKVDKAVWFVSHCKTSSMREHYVRKMQSVMGIDVFGDCGVPAPCPKKSDDIEQCFDDAAMKYKYYLAFENTLVEDYVTEKVFRWYIRDIVVVVRGGSNYSRILPPGTFVDAGDFSSPVELGKYLKQLALDKKRYTDILKTKDNYYSTDEFVPVQEANCKLCEYLNNLDDHRKRYQWKQAGKPGPEHPLSVQKRVTKKQLRTLQRQQQSEYRSSIYNNIMEAHTSDRKLFYSLVSRQRKEGSTSLGRLVVDDVHLTTSEAIRQGWATYFQNLATPKEKDNYNIEYKQQVDLDFELICDICSKLQSCTPLVSQTEVEQIIKSLKNNKAMDGCGVSAEHLKYGGSTVVEFVTCVLNEIFRLGRVPEMFKLGFITPIYKKHGKPIHDPNSYRRITITSLIGKVLEKYILQTAFAEIERKQNPLQKGFTKGTSATTAALMFTEALAEAKDTKTTLYAACIDASKAFDVVWHHSMLRKLFSMGLTPASWNILKDSYTGMSSVVNWGGELSKPFVEQQGVRQGGIISPSAYKMFLNPLLDLYSSNSLGLQIGNVYLGSPACADDLLFLAKTATELQEMIFVQEFYANAERYDVSDTKTKVFIANSVVSNEIWNENSTFVLNGRKVEVVEECVHLGITRDSKSRSGHAKTIDERIQSARRCAYSLMGAGLHGQNGVNPLVSFTMWNVFILPCLLYGLDVLTLVKSDIAKITQFHKKFLKQIMHLPDRTADAAVYMLSGQIPVEGEIHKRTLGALGGILRSDSVERRLAERQIHVKDGKSKSWFVYVNKVLEQYGLPSTVDLLDAGYAKAQWKSLYEQAVNEYWSDKILEEAMGKTSMRFMNVQNYPIGLAHLVWRDAGYDIMSVQRAGWKARLMSGTYMLQATRARFNQFEVDPTCLICCKEPENIEHFLLRCESLNKIRQPFLDKIYKLIQNSLGVAKLNDFKINDTEFTAILLDCTVLIDPNSVLLLEAFLHEMEPFSRGLCYALHMKRTSLLSQSN